MRLLSLVAAFTATVAVVCGNCDKHLLPELTFHLTGTNLEWPCSATRSIFSTSGRYMSRNIITTRVQMYKDEAIVVTPRYKPGIPFTLGKVSLRSKYNQATLEPFPFWSMQEEGNCQALQSAVDLFLDLYDILWVLDVGIVNTLHHPVRHCPPKVVGFNVKTGKVVKVVDLSGLVIAGSHLQYLVADQSHEGHVFLYISDAATRALLVYDVTANRGFRVVLPKAVTEGCTRRDVLYLSLVRKLCGTNVLYFTYLSGSNMFSVTTEHLQSGSAKGTVVDVGSKTGHIVLLGTDNAATIFFRLKGESDIYMWNTETCFKPENFLLVQTGNGCRLATQVTPGYRRLMWVLESNFHDYIQETVGCAGPSVVLHPLVRTFSH